jgi:dTDP-4-dehydrorhamnose reductase
VFAQAIVQQAALTPPSASPTTTTELDRLGPGVAFSVLANRAQATAIYPPLRPWPEALAAMLTE